MPAAAVIPAPIAYAYVVAVKKLVVGFLPGFGGSLFGVTAICPVSLLPDSWGCPLPGVP